MNKNLLSNCCHAPMNIGGDDREGTHYFQCSKCEKPCDPAQDKAEAKE